MKYEKLLERFAQIALRVPSESWDDTIDYYRDIVGLHVVERGGDAMLMRAKRDRFHHTLALLRSDRAGMERAVWKVPEAADLDIIRERVQAHDLEVTDVPAGALPGVGRAIEFVDFGGHHMVCAAEIATVAPVPEPWRGASAHFLDHYNMNYSTALDDARALYVDGLGLQVADTAAVDGGIIGHWLRAGTVHHDVAIMAGGDFFHHVAFRLASPDDIRRASDQFADLRYPIEHGPAAHSPMGMYFLYVKDPAGNRNELFVDEMRCWTTWETGHYADDEEGDLALHRLLARFGPIPQPDFYVTGT
jgi:catechol 2,3-dioxygenase